MEKVKRVNKVKKLNKMSKKMKMKNEFLENIMTSGEAAMKAVSQNRYGKYFYHLGPKRDNSIFEKSFNASKVLKTSIPFDDAFSINALTISSEYGL